MLKIDNIVFNKYIILQLFFGIIFSSCDEVHYQAHRGGGLNKPDNAMSSFIYTWERGGIPECDIRMTKDSILVCLHDPTLNRTVENLSLITYINELRVKDINSLTLKNTQGETIPLLKEVLLEMSESSDNYLYIDIKNVDENKLLEILDDYASKIIVASSNIDYLKKIKEKKNNLRTMLWIGGSKENKIAKFNKLDFKWIDQVQIHLKFNSEDDSYDISYEELKKFKDISDINNIDFEVFPFVFSEVSLKKLHSIGIRWFAIDYPDEFVEILK